MSLNSVNHPLNNSDTFRLIESYLPVNDSGRSTTVSNDLRSQLVLSQYNALRNSPSGSYSREIFRHVHRIDNSYNGIVSKTMQIISNCMDKEIFNYWSSKKNFPELLANFNARPPRFFEESCIEAARTGNLEQLSALFQTNGITHQITRDLFVEMFFEAARNGQKEVVQPLIRQNILTPVDFERAFTLASQGNHQSVIEVLINREQDLTPRSRTEAITRELFEYLRREENPCQVIPAHKLGDLLKELAFTPESQDTIRTILESNRVPELTYHVIQQTIESAIQYRAFENMSMLTRFALEKEIPIERELYGKVFETSAECDLDLCEQLLEEDKVPTYAVNMVLSTACSKGNLELLDIVLSSAQFDIDYSLALRFSLTGLRNPTDWEIDIALDVVAKLTEYEGFYTDLRVAPDEIYEAFFWAVEAGDFSLIDDLIDHPNFKLIPVAKFKKDFDHLKSAFPEYDRTELKAVLKEMKEQQSLRR